MMSPPTGWPTNEIDNDGTVVEIVISDMVRPLIEDCSSLSEKL